MRSTSSPETSCGWSTTLRAPTRSRSATCSRTRRSAYINVDHTVRKHFAVFGTSGVGKSSGIALIVRQILHARPDLRVFLIDPHNEYGHCFGEQAQILTPTNLKLPFWLF